MHTGDKIGGRICRCMACSAKRRERLHREALLRRTQPYQRATRELAEAEEAVASAHAARDAKRAALNAILSEVQTAIVNAGEPS